MQIVVGKTANPKTMLWILASLWIIHFSVGFYPLMVNMDIVSQPSGVYCFPDFRKSDLLHRSYAIVVVTYLLLVLSIITASYYEIWRKAVADGFKWNEKSFVIKNIEHFRHKPHVQPTILNESATKIKISDLSLKTPAPSVINNSKYQLPAPEVTLASDIGSSQDETARSRQLAMTKKLAIITFALYIGGKFVSISLTAIL
ncbi:hypothetical protein BKA69DRAFT_1039202 [Paraphysoderma sedebokerense]|nr:hypothetical protein BKA69DRAFT_1039202 [Paraphysoderma sedebokerense]